VGVVGWVGIGWGGVKGTVFLWIGVWVCVVVAVRGR